MRGLASSNRRTCERVSVVLLGGHVKRGFDIGAAALGLIFISPLFLLVACLGRFADGEPAFQTHPRIARRDSLAKCQACRATSGCVGRLPAIDLTGRAMQQSLRPRPHPLCLKG
ncbi:hypothetical protein ILFOPFJJ_05371 [Ensifer psoraleae]|nr:hypothetical protein [Sinorhizobium psoraleae]